jgi:hypothetical protein
VFITGSWRAHVEIGHLYGNFTFVHVLLLYEQQSSDNIDKCTVTSVVDNSGYECQGLRR